MKLVGLLPTDASVLQRLGELHLAEGDEAAAAQYYNDAYRYFPSNMDVIQRLGAHYLKAQFYEKAISFFERASIIQYVLYMQGRSQRWGRGGNRPPPTNYYRINNRRTA